MKSSNLANQLSLGVKLTLTYLNKQFRRLNTNGRFLSLGLILFCHSFNLNGQNGTYISKETFFKSGTNGELERTQMTNIISIDLHRKGAEAYGKVIVTMPSKDGSVDIEYHVYGLPMFENLDFGSALTYKAEMVVLGTNTQSKHEVAVLTNDKTGGVSVIIVNLPDDRRSYVTYQHFFNLEEI